MGKGSGGGGTNTTVQQSGPPPQVLAEYQSLVNQSQGVAATPYQPYSGQMVAGFTPEQTSAFQTINNSQGISQPYINQAQSMIQNSNQPIWSNVQQFNPSTVQQYMSPYTNDVVNATAANINENNQEQQQKVIGNAVSSGAWGGDRSAVAQAEMARQQGLAEDQTIAQLRNQGYGQGLSEFNTQQQAQIGANEANAWLNSQGAFGESNLGKDAQQSALTDATAQLQAGQLEQQQNQANLNVPYEQYLGQQAYPFQTTGWLSNIVEGLGGSSGSQGTTTAPAPSSSSGMFGMGAMLGGMGGKMMGGMERGGRIRMNNGGIVPHFDDGGSVGQAQGITPETYANNFLATGFNPVATTQYQELQNAPEEKLREYIARSGNSPQAAQARNILQKRMIAPQPQGQPQGFAFGGNVLPDIVSVVGDVVGAFYGDPMAGSQATGMLSKMDNGETKPGIQMSDITSIFNKGGRIKRLADGGSSDDEPADLEALPGLTSAVPQLPAPASDARRAGIAPANGVLTDMAEASAPAQGISPSQRPEVDTSKITNAQPINKIDPWQALFAAGAATMAGRSPYAMQNIGAGALAGMNNYMGQKKEAAAESEKRGDAEAKAQKLVQDVYNERERMNAENARDTNLASHYKNMDTNSANTLDLKRQEDAQAIKENAAQRDIDRQNMQKNRFKVTPFGDTVDSWTGETKSLGVQSGADPEVSQQLTMMGPVERAAFQKQIGKQMPKDLQQNNANMVQYNKSLGMLDDAIKTNRLASSGDAHAVADFMDRNGIPLFGDQARGEATTTFRSDVLGNALSGLKSTFGARPTNLDVNMTLKEMNASPNMSADQREALLHHLRDQVATAAKYETEYGKDIRSGKFYLPDYENSAAKDLRNKLNPAVAAPASSGSSATAPAIPPMPKSVPQGSSYSPSRGMWRDPQGRIYNVNGEPVS